MICDMKKKNVPLVKKEPEAFCFCPKLQKATYFYLNVL